MKRDWLTQTTPAKDFGAVSPRQENKVNTARFGVSSHNPKATDDEFDKFANLKDVYL